MIPLKRAILDYLLLTCHLWAIMAELILLDSLLKEIPIVYIFYNIHRRIMFFDLNLKNGGGKSCFTPKVVIFT